MMTSRAYRWIAMREADPSSAVVMRTWTAMAMREAWSLLSATMIATLLRSRPSSAPARARAVASRSLSLQFVPQNS